MNNTVVEDELPFDDNSYDICYECTGLGDDYTYDPDLDALVSNCDTCPFRTGGSND